jgi:hypothetical protein
MGVLLALLSTALIQIGLCVFCFIKKARLKV